MNAKAIGDLIQLIATVKTVRFEDISPQSILHDDLGISSLEYIMIVTEYASMLGADLLSITESDLISAKTVADLSILFDGK